MSASRSGVVTFELAPPDQLRPVRLEGHAHARARQGLDDRLELERAAVVPDPHLVAGRDPPRRCVVRVQEQARRPGLVAMPGLGRERRVEQEARRRDDQHQREAQRELRVRDLGGRCVADERVEPVGGETVAAQLDPAALRREPTPGERRGAVRVSDPHPCALAQRLERHAGRTRGGRVQDLLGDLLVRVLQARVVEPERKREAAEHVGVRQALTGRLDGRRVERHVEVAVGVVQVEVLGLHRDGQHDIGEVGGVGAALLEHHREQVVAREPAAHARLVRHGRGGVRRPHDHGMDGRVVEVEECLGEPRHVDRARRRRDHAGRADGSVVVEREVTAGHADRAAARHGASRPVTAGIDMIGADRRARAAMALQAEADSQRGRTRVREPPPEPAHDLGVEPADARGPLHGPLRRAAPRAPASRPCAARASRDPRQPSSRTTRISPSASARVGARDAARCARRCAPRWPSAAGRCTTTCAPRSRASSTKRHWCRLRREQVRAPQDHEPRVPRSSSGSMPTLPPSVASCAARRRRRADRRAEPRGAERAEQARAERPALDRAPSCPRSSTGAPTPARGGRSPSADPSAASPIASSQPIRSKRPSPFGPTRRSGCSRRSSPYTRVEVAVDLAAERARA